MTPPRKTIGQTLLAAVCELEPGRAAALLPAPLRPVADRAFAYLVWATLEVPGAPVRARSFVEGNLVLPCEGPEGEGTWFLRAWFERRDLVRNAVLSGWGGVAAQISVGRLPAGVQALGVSLPPTVGGWVARDGRRELELAVTPGARCELDDTPLRRFHRVYGVRTAGGARDVTIEHHHEDRMRAVHEGAATLRLAGDAAAALGPHRVAGGVLIEFGIDYAGSRVAGTPWGAAQARGDIR